MSTNQSSSNPVPLSRIQRVLGAQNEHLPFAIISVLATAVLVWLSSLRHDPTMIMFHDLDETAFHNSVRMVWDGIRQHNLEKLFAFSFYNYGFGFFVANVLVNLPWLITHNEGAAIVTSRIFCGLFAIGSAVLVYKIAIRSLKPLIATGITLCLLLMPGFWFNAAWFHPDWMMTFFIVLAVDYLLQDDGSYGKLFTYAIVSFAVGLSVKQQALYYAPGFLLLIFAPVIRKQGGASIAKSLVMVAKTVGILVAVFLATNPYMLHPTGMRQWIKATLANSESNATNHGSNVKVTLADKLMHVINAEYMPVFVMLLLLGGIFFWRKSEIKASEKWIWISVWASAAVSLLYLFVGVNKEWPHYYVTSIVFVVLLAIPLAQSLDQRRQNVVIGVLGLIQLSFLAMNAGTCQLNQRYFQVSEQRQQAEQNRAFLAKCLSRHVNPSSELLISPYVPFDYIASGMEVRQVKILYRELSEGMLSKESFIRENPSYPLWKFAKPTFIVLRKTTHGKDPKPIDINENPVVGDLIKGKLGYHILAENPLLYVLEEN